MVTKNLVQADEELETLIAPRLFIIQKKYGYRYSEDAIALTNFISALPPISPVLDLGCGGGIMTVLLADAWSDSHFVGVELQSNLADMARRSVFYNDLQERIRIENADLRDPTAEFARQKYPLVIMNPPFYRTDNARLSPILSRRLANHEVGCTFNDICQTVRQVLAPEGRFIFIHISERDSEIRQTLDRFGFSIHQISYIKSRILIACG